MLNAAVYRAAALLLGTVDQRDDRHPEYERAIVELVGDLTGLNTADQYHEILDDLHDLAEQLMH